MKLIKLANSLQVIIRRMLPVIDLVNHMDHSTLPMLWLVILAAVLDDDDNDFSTSLISTRDIQLGEELLFDCGGDGSGGGGRWWRRRWREEEETQHDAALLPR